MPYYSIDAIIRTDKPPPISIGDLNRLLDPHIFLDDDGSMLARKEAAPQRKWGGVSF
jgi:hypothetical protein